MSRFKNEPTHAHYLVAGGAGFLGSYIVEALVARGEDHVAVYDLTEPSEADKVPTVSYFRGDICDAPRLVDVLGHTQTTIVFHVASPVRGLPDSIYTRVNVKGTRTLLEACRHPSLNGAIGKLVYTSSTGVVWTSKELAGVSEDEVGIPDKGFDAYHHTKAVAESMVLAENKGGLRTVAMRPCGMIGPRDGQLLFRLARLLADGQHKIQIGDNSASIDWVYPGNVADAHLLAVDRLPWPAEDDVSADTTHAVAGQAFFITNGMPMRQLDFSRMVWLQMGAPLEDFKPRSITKIPRWWALCVATATEAWCAVTGGTTEFTRFSIRYLTTTQWYNIEKARNVLGYEPRVTLEESVHLATKWWKERGEREYLEKPEATPFKKA